MRAYALGFLLMTLLACGSSPSAPSVGQPGKPAPPAAHIVPIPDSTIFEALTPDGVYPWTSRARNDGPGCAKQVTVTTVFRDGAGVEVERMVWQFNTTRILLPGEAFEFGGTLKAENAPRVVNFTANFTWINVAC